MNFTPSDMQADTLLRKAHTGLLREELILLRHTLGLDFSRSKDKYDLACAKNGGKNLPGSQVKDLLIVSVDIEGRPIEVGKENFHCRVGVSILDTRHLGTRITDTNRESVLETFNYCIVVNSIEDIRHEINKLIFGRETVLVVHGGRDDLAFLKAAQIDLRPLHILDTQKVAQHPLDLDHRCNLGELLTLLKCPFNPEMLHSAGNDANFTLRALLLVATLDARNRLDGEPGELDCKSLLWTLESIATEFIPLEEFRRKFEKEIVEYVKRANPKSHGRKARRKAHEKATRKK